MTLFRSHRASAPLARGVVAVLLLSSSGWAADGGSRAGHGHVSVVYQNIRVDGFEGLNGEVPIGTVDTHTLFVEIDYNLTDRWTLIAGLPLVRERYNGDFPHDPLRLDPPRPEVENVDEGSWNTAFQDFHLGVRYLALDGPLTISPYLFVGIPSHDYPHFGHAAIGQNLNKIEPGATVTWLPQLSRVWYQLDLGYVFVEKTLGVSINHWLARGEVGYFFGDRLRGRAFVIYKNGSGLTSGRADFPDRTLERWFQHDRMLKHNFTNVGIAVDWAAGNRYEFTSALMTQTRAEQVHKMDYAITLGLSWSF